MPRHLAVSPFGNTIVVAVHGGGAYNALPIFRDGSVGCVSSAMKETGCGPIPGHQNSAHPQSVLFDPTGNRVIATDLGSDRLRVFSLAESDGSMATHFRTDLPSGSGPKHITLHPSGNFLYVDHVFDNSISGFHYDPATGHIGERFTHMQGTFGDALAIHPQGDFLYSSHNGKLSVWQIQSETGALHPLQSIELSVDDVRGISALPDGSNILALTSSGIQRFDVDAISGCLTNSVIVAPISGARSIAFQASIRSAS
jgi:6-phosphogluconolactonase (cycloisomerase 2 family)